MKKTACFMALAGSLSVISLSAAWALNHLQANRIHIYNPGQCSRPTGPLWIQPGTGQAVPGFVNVNVPEFDQIGALLTGNVLAQPEAVLQEKTPPCGIIASFYKNAAPVGAWIIPPDKLDQFISILNRHD